MVDGPPSFADLLRWRWRRRKQRREADRLDGEQFEVLRPDVEFLAANRGEPTLTWIGHVTFLLQLGGLNIITDPHMTQRASPLPFAGPRRLVPLPLHISELPRIDVVLISHNHYDHLDAGTVTRLAGQPGGQPRFLVPLGLKPWFAQHGIFHVTELDWWESEEMGEVGFHFVPAQHWSKRTPFDTNQSLWGGWLAEAPEFRFHFCGDTGYSRDFEDIHQRFGAVDLSALPIGAYDPRWFMGPQHVDPEEAVRIFLDLQARYAAGMHWGTFKLTDEPIQEPPRRLAEALAAYDISPERFFLMKFGETRYLRELQAREPVGRALDPASPEPADPAAGKSTSSEVATPTAGTSP